MPKKKDWGAPTRQSSRLTEDASEEPTTAKSFPAEDKLEEPSLATTAAENELFLADPVPAESLATVQGAERRLPAWEDSNDDSLDLLQYGDSNPKELEIDPDHPFLSTEEQAEEEDPAFKLVKETPELITSVPERPLLSTTDSRTMPESSQPAAASDVATQAATAAIVAAVLAELRKSGAPVSTNEDPQARETTPAESVFGGTTFVPKGPAAFPAFKPYDAQGDSSSPNPNYDKKSRAMGIDPGKFDGDEGEFDAWVERLADKLVEDAETFKNERSRMAVVNSLTTGQARSLLEFRYSHGSTNPFKNTAEMIATLAGVFHDEHGPSKAREELRKLMFNPKSQNIYQFVSKVNTLCDLANVHQSERKTILFEHLPVGLDARLRGDSRDTNVSYETFTTRVADAALEKQRLLESIKEKHSKSPDKDERRRKRRERQDQYEHKYRKADKSVDPAAYKPENKPKGEEEDRTCYSCKKAGHVARNCLDKHQVATLFRRMEADGAFLDSGKESGSSSDDDSTPSLADESKNEEDRRKSPRRSMYHS